MTRNTRFFLIGSALVVAAGLFTGLVAYYNGALGARAAGPSELAYVPPDVTAVAYANVRTVMDSEFRQRIRQIVPTGEAQDALRTELGVDIEHDIDTVVAAFRADGSSDAGAVVIVRGRFDDDQIEMLAVQHGGVVESYRGKRLILTPGQPAESAGAAGVAGGGGVAFLEPGLLALGDAGSIRRAIDAAATREDVTTNADIMKVIAEVDGTGNAWAVGRFDALSTAQDLPEHVRSQVAAVQWVSVSANVNGGISGTLRAEARDDQSAENLRDVIRGGLAAARLLGGQDPRVEAMLNSLQLMGTGRSVALSFAVSPDVLDLLNGLAALDRMGEPAGGSAGIRK